MRRALAATALGLLALASPALAVTRDDVASEIRRVFGPAAPRALRIAHCESRLNPSATHRNRNGTTDVGVFQINDGGTMQSLGLTRAEAYDYRENIQAAYRLYRDRGWQPWVCR